MNEQELTLKERAEQIRDASEAGENTAERVGGLMVDIVDEIESGGGGGGNALTPIAVRIEKGKAYILGADELRKSGAQLVIFRRCRKSNRVTYFDEEEGEDLKKIGPVRVGWNAYFSPELVKFADDGHMLFAQVTEDDDALTEDYTADPKGSLVLVKTDKKDVIYVPWGRGKAWLKNDEKSRPLRMHFALGFVREYHQNKAVTPADLCSTLAQFSVVVNYNDEEEDITARLSRA